jgi:hypothetical protein
LLVSSTSETNEYETWITLSSDRFYDIDNNTIAGDHDDLFHNALHLKKGNAHNVFFHRYDALLEFLTNKAFSKNNLQQIQQHKMTIIPILSARLT